MLSYCSILNQFFSVLFQNCHHHHHHHGSQKTLQEMNVIVAKVTILTMATVPQSVWKIVQMENVLHRANVFAMRVTIWM